MNLKFAVAFSLIFFIGVSFILFLDKYIPSNMEYLRVLFFVILIAIPKIISNSIGLEKMGEVIVKKFVKYIFPLGYIFFILLGIYKIYLIFHLG